MDKVIIKIACVGDSITYGMTLEEREDDCYPSTLESMLNQRSDAEGVVYRVRNFGVNQTCVWRRRSYRYADTPECGSAARWRADIYVVCLGTNDAAGRTEGAFAKEFTEDYRNLVRSLTTDAPDAVVLVAKIPPIPGYPNLEGAVKLVNGILETVAMEQGTAPVDLHEVLAGRDGLFSDGVHPNSAGARMIADAVFQALHAIPMASVRVQ